MCHRDVLCFEKPLHFFGVYTCSHVCNRVLFLGPKGGHVHLGLFVFQFDGLGLGLPLQWYHGCAGALPTKNEVKTLGFNKQICCRIAFSNICGVHNHDLKQHLDSHILKNKMWSTKGATHIYGRRPSKVFIIKGIAIPLAPKGIKRLQLFGVVYESMSPFN